MKKSHKRNTNLKRNNKGSKNDLALRTFNAHKVVTRLGSIRVRDELSLPYVRIHKVQQNIYTNSTSANYTFTSGSDVRFYSVPSMLAASSSFSNLIAAFQYYTILGFTLQYLPINTNADQVLSTYLAPIILNVNDNIGSPANPNNAKLQDINSALIHAVTKLTETVKPFVSPVNIMSVWNGVMNTKYNTQSSTPQSGQVELGQQSTSVFPTTAEQVGMLNIHIHIAWEGPIA
jgi:hypothetical protein